MIIRRLFSMQNHIRAVVPAFSAGAHKGQRGRVGVFGGSADYTGAPYFAAISALRTGCDLVYVVCPPAAAPVIKSYHPDLIVLPYLPKSDLQRCLETLLPKLHSVVVGPGLGRSAEAGEAFKMIMESCLNVRLPTVIDADGLYFVSEGYLDGLSEGYIEGSELHPQVYFTPNKMEQARLTSISPEQLHPATLVNKGPVDVIINSAGSISCDIQGSLRRCGGQGDLLSGALGTLAAWASFGGGTPELAQSAAYTACALTRSCNRLAYDHVRHGVALKDSMTTNDMVELIHVAKHKLGMSTE